MQIESEALLADLMNRTEENLAAAKTLAAMPDAQLQQKPTAHAWNALECLEHLNRYGNFYLPEIDKRLNAATQRKATLFKSGFLGNKFALMMLPGAKGMKTFKVMNPIDNASDKKVITTFIEQQQQLLQLLKKCSSYDLGKIKTSISISNFIKLKLGDTLRVVIYHNQRHMLQAQKAAAL